jgi:hypothetical protein
MLIWLKIKYGKILYCRKLVTLMGVLLSRTVFWLYWSTMKGIRFSFAKISP